MKVSELNKIIEETISQEIKDTILKEGSGDKTAYCIKCEGEYVEVCDTKEEADQKCEEYNKNNPDKDFVVEIETYESKQDLLDKLDQLGEELDSKDMKKDHSIEELEQDQNESAFVLAADAAKDAGKDEFEFPKGSGKMHPVQLKQILTKKKNVKSVEIKCTKMRKELSNHFMKVNVRIVVNNYVNVVVWMKSQSMKLKNLRYLDYQNHN